MPHWPMNPTGSAGSLEVPSARAWIRAAELAGAWLKWSSSRVLIRGS